MCKSVKSLGSTLNMPVIEEIIVEEGAPYKAVLINIDLEDPLEGMCNKKAVFSYCQTVVKNGSMTVLGKILHYLSFRTENNALTAIENFLRQLILRNALFNFCFLTMSKLTFYREIGYHKPFDYCLTIDYKYAIFLLKSEAI